MKQILDTLLLNIGFEKFEKITSRGNYNDIYKKLSGHKDGINYILKHYHDYKNNSYIIFIKDWDDLGSGYNLYDSRVQFNYTMNDTIYRNIINILKEEFIYELRKIKVDKLLK